MENVNAFHRRSALRARCSGQRGQTMIFVVLGLGIVFLAVLGFAIDFGNLWFKRQTAQSAADAACTAAVMDMLYNVQNSPATAVGGFTTGTAFDCASKPGAGPCLYASLNGYNGAGLAANTESNSVQVSFPTPDCTATPNDPLCLLPAFTYPVSPGSAYVPPSAAVANPFVRVLVTDRMGTGFFRMVGAAKTLDVPAKASCAILMKLAPIPILILDPHRDKTLQLTGGMTLKIWGGPPDSIQVNSDNAGAFTLSGNNGQIDLHLGGPNNTGSNFHTDVAQSASITKSPPLACTAPPSGPDLCLGTTGSYATNPAIQDPLRFIAAPAKPTGLARSVSGAVLKAPNVDGCPAPSGTPGCYEFLPGYYSGGINLSGSSANPYYAIFAPGIYYVENGMSFGAHTCVRPAVVPGDGSGGTFFYFGDNSSIGVSGGGCADLSGGGGGDTPATPFVTKTTSGTAPYQYGAACDATSYAGLPANLDNPVSGSVLLAPCQGPTDATLAGPNYGINGGTGYGDPQGTSDPFGLQRGLLFMQNRSQTISGASNQPHWQGGGAFLLSGAMYFHQCHTSGTDTGVGCDATNAFTDQLTIGGNASGNSYVLGDVVVDQLKLNGTTSLYLDLSPLAQFPTFKASLVQ